MYDPEKARQLLAEAGHAGGFDAGFYTCEVAYADLGEAALNYLGEVGIRAKLRPLANSLLLAAVAMAFWLLVGIPSGILAAVRVGRFWDSAGKLFRAARPVATSRGVPFPGSVAIVRRSATTTSRISSDAGR